MASRFMTDPHAMRDMAGRFEVHAQTVEDEARRMWASAQNISGAGWSGMAEATSLDTMTQMNQAFRNIVNMLHGVRDGLVRDANNYEQQEQASQQILARADVHPLRACASRRKIRPETSWFWAILRLLAQPGLQRCQVLFGCARNRSQRNRLIEGDKSAIMSDREGQQVRVGDLFGAVQAGTIDDL